MREIKFRTLVNGEWLYFDLTQNPKYWAHKLKDGIIDQYTGLNDVNGKYIYEGDILRFNHAIGWSGEYQSVKSDKWGWGTEEYEFCKMVDYKYLFEVVGNIYENPEILENN